jgi:hypothetical protein
VGRENLKMLRKGGPLWPFFFNVWTFFQGYFFHPTMQEGASVNIKITLTK